MEIESSSVYLACICCHCAPYHRGYRWEKISASKQPAFGLGKLGCDLKSNKLYQTLLDLTNVNKIIKRRREIDKTQIAAPGFMKNLLFPSEGGTRGWGKKVGISTECVKCSLSPCHPVVTMTILLEAEQGTKSSRRDPWTRQWLDDCRGDCGHYINSLLGLL